MEKEKFQVIFAGKFAEDKRIPEIKQNLVKLFKAAPSKIDVFFSGKKFIVKKNLTRQTALKYIRVLQDAGIICQIKPHPLKRAESLKKAAAVSPRRSTPHPLIPTLTRDKEIILSEDAREENVLFNKRLFIKVSICIFILMGLASWFVIHYFQKPQRQDIHFSESLGFEFVYIPSGTFIMGSPSGETDRYDDETLHTVTLTKGFYLQKTEVTQRQWSSVMDNNPSFFQRCGDNCPVEHVSWKDIQEFIRKLNQREGRDAYRLPTEAEWEYACRAGSTTRFCYGNEEERLEEYAWFEKNSEGRTHPVGHKNPNIWGLFDMHGNVWEWCQDWYGKYPSGSAIDPNGPTNGSGRALRGGSVLNASWNIRSALRSSDPPDFRDGVLGFRLVRHR